MTTNLTARAGLLALMASTALCGVAQAQSAPVEPAAVGEIVVTAQRREQRLSDVPISVQAQTGEQLERAGMTDSRALEQISPAVNFTASYSATTTSVVIRGAASQANEGGIQPSVGLVIDNMPIARQGEFVQNLADIDRIEVLSGPQGTLFGKNSTAGVINIVSSRPKDVIGSSAELTATTDEEFIAKAMVNVPVSDMLKTRVNAYYQDLNPLVKNLHPIGDQMGQKAYGFQGKALFDLGGSADLLLTSNYNYSNSTFGFNNVLTPISGPMGVLQRQAFGDVIGRGKSVINQDTISYNKVRSYAFIGELNWDLTEDLKLTAIVGHRNYLSKLEIDVDGGPIGSNIGRGRSANPLNYPLEYVETGNRHQPEQYIYTSYEARLAYSVDRLDAVGGLYYQNYDETRRTDMPFIMDGSYALGDPSLFGVKFISEDALDTAASDNTFAVFGDATYEVVPTVKVFAGLRYTREKLSLDYNKISWFNPLAQFDLQTSTNLSAPVATQNFEVSRTDNNVSGRLGLQWQPASGQNYYASYNRGFKGAAANQGRATAPATALLDPELATAFEVGTKQRFWDGRASVDVAIYQQTIKNIQQNAVLPNSVTVDLINAGNLKAKGVELTTHFLVADGLTVDLGGVYNDAYYSGKDASGQPVRFSCGPSMTPGVGKCRADGTQSLVGQQAISSPKWKFVGSVNYERALANEMKVSMRVAYTWRSSIQYQLYEDPLTREPDAGLLDASIGIGSDDGRWQVTLFGKNLTNHFYYSNLNTADFFIGRQFGSLPRDFKRYGGIRFNYKM